MVSPVHPEDRESLALHVRPLLQAVGFDHRPEDDGYRLKSAALFCDQSVPNAWAEALHLSLEENSDALLAKKLKCRCR